MLKSLPKIFSLVVEPAEYTLDLVRKIYHPLGVEYAFIRGDTPAGGESLSKDTVIISRLSFFSKVKYILRMLADHDIIIVNGYIGREQLLFILLNIVLYKKPLAIESDTELQIPASLCRRILKHMWLGFLFSREYCYGFPAGRYKHREVFTHYGMKDERVFVMPMVIDECRFCLNKSGKMRDGIFRFGVIGRLIRIKQVDKIITAFKELIKSGLTMCELHIIGDGPERSKLETLSQHYDNVIFHGFVYGDDKIELLSRMDAVILYSTHDQWGFVINEALAVGCPVIVSDRVGCRHELVDEVKVPLGESGDNNCALGPTGCVCDYLDIASLSTTMLRMVKDVTWRSELAANASARSNYWGFALYEEQFLKFIDIIEGME